MTSGRKCGSWSANWSIWARARPSVPGCTRAGRLACCTAPIACRRGARPSRSGTERTRGDLAWPGKGAMTRVWVFALLLSVLPVTASAQPCAEPLAVLFERVSPSVVSIQATKINKAKPQRRFETIVGSGVIIDKDGQILTNAHVVDGAASLSVTLDSGAKVTARVMGLDPVLDLALLRVESSGPLPAARLGDSAGINVGHEGVALAAAPARPSQRLGRHQGRG